jgi:hypothetical protein
MKNIQAARTTTQMPTIRQRWVALALAIFSVERFNAIVPVPPDIRGQI